LSLSRRVVAWRSPTRARLASAALALGLLAAPLGVAAQPQEGKTYRVGWLAPAPNPDNLEALRSGLRALGYLEGTNLVIETRYAQGALPELAAAAAELVRDRPDVIVTDGSQAAAAARRSATSPPVVFVSGDPVGMGLVPSLSRPGGNMTGFGIVSTELNVKRLELLRDAFPGASRVGVLHEARQLKSMIPPMEAAARALGLKLTRLQVRVADDLDPAFAAAVREHVDVVVPVASALFHAEKQRLLALAATHRLPTMYENRAFPDAGGLMSYGPDVADVFRRAAGYVDRILTGTRPADLPVQQPTKFDLVINLRTARTLGVSIPPSLLLRADRVIE
jgi:putative ABC transport system substrate-binding protein